MKIVYAAPTHKLAEEVRDKAVGFLGDRDVNVLWIRGRARETEQLPETCLRMDEVDESTSRGFSPALVVCWVCNHKSNEDCPYLQQLKELSSLEAGFFVTTHAQVKSLDLNECKVDILVIDEDPVGNFIESSEIGITQMTEFRSKLPETMAVIFSKIQTVIDDMARLMDEAPEKPGTHDRAYATEIPEGSHWEGKPDLWKRGGVSNAEKETLSRNLAVFDRMYKENRKLESVGQWQRRLFDEGIHFGALMWLFYALGDKTGGTAYIKVLQKLKSSANGGPRDKFVYVEKKVPDFKGRIIILDGTGRKPEVDALLQREFVVFDGSVSLEGCSKVFIRRAMGKTKSKKMSDDELKKILKQAFSELKLTDEKVLLGTHLAIEERIGDLANQLLPNKIIATTHFGENRGINKFEDFNAFIGIGAMTINQVGALDTAMVLFKEKAKRDEWFSWQGESDLIQTLHRIRPILGGKTIILVGRYWPKDLGPPNYIIDARRGDKVADQSFNLAYERAHAFVLCHGFLIKDLAWGLGIGSTREKEAVLATQRRIKKAIANNPKKTKPPQKGPFYLI